MFSRLAGDRPKKSHFIVKVIMETSEDILKVYSEDHMLCGEIIQRYTASDAAQIKDKIRKEGNKARKGFFYAILPKDGESMKDGVNVVEVKINTEKIQPIEKW